MDAKPKRRWFRFSLRSLLVLTTIACLGSGWLGMKVRAIQREREAVRAIRDLGVGVFYDYEWQETPPPGPAWLRKSFGDDLFANVVFLNFGPDTTDADLHHLGSLNRLEVLYLSGTQVTDPGLAYLKELSHLERLYLAGTKITDAGLVHLGHLKEMKEVYLGGSQVTDAGAATLQEALPNLRIDR